MEVSSQFHAPAALPQREEPPFPTESWSCVYTRSSMDYMAVRKTYQPAGTQTFMFRSSSQLSTNTANMSYMVEK